MNKELQQKIIGGAVIVIFLAVAIPFLFTGKKKDNVDTATQTTTESVNIPNQNVQPTPISSPNDQTLTQNQPPHSLQNQQQITSQSTEQLQNQSLDAQSQDNYKASIKQEHKSKTHKVVYRVVLQPVHTKNKADNLAKRVAKNFQVKTIVLER